MVIQDNVLVPGSCSERESPGHAPFIPQRPATQSSSSPGPHHAEVLTRKFGRLYGRLGTPGSASAGSGNFK
eukprot:596922-Hanusia_phi.AAC.1